VVAALVTVQAARAATSAPRRPLHGPGDVTVDLRITHSHFSLAHLDVEAGTTVRFVVTNTDPIGHELIVGGPAVHERHERGHEASHPPVPGEVSVPPLATSETTYRFDAPGTVVFACHLPGHLAYGMRGEVDVHPAAAGR
jgi:uncharacterized cupredoxin-like copper-binding protein